MNPIRLEELESCLGRCTPYQSSGLELVEKVRTLAGGLLRHARLGPDGPLVVLLFGGANTGKSTVFNALTGRDLSPVLAIAGTTRHALAYVPERALETLSRPAVWPEPHPPAPYAGRDDLTADRVPRRVHVTGHDDSRLARFVLVDAPDMTTTYRENARISSQLLLLCDIVLLVLTDEQHADQILVDHFQTMRDLGKKVLAVFNRVRSDRPEDSGAFQKFRIVWLENRMGDVPERVFLPRMAPGRASAELAAHPALAQLLAGLERSGAGDLHAQVRTGLELALRKRGEELVAHLRLESQNIGRALDEIRARYRSFVAAYNAERRWASRLLEVRSVLSTTFEVLGGATSGPSPDDAKREEAWRRLVTPLVSRQARPSALEGLELMAQALEAESAPAPLYRPFTRLYRGLKSLVWGTPAALKEGDPPSLEDALDLLEAERCRFVASEVLLAALGPEWRRIQAGDGSPAAALDPQLAERVADSYRRICADLVARVREVSLANPDLRARMSQQHARLALAAGIAAALALIDGGHSVLAVGVGLGAPALFWELMDWAASRPELAQAFEQFALAKARWMEESFGLYVTGSIHERLSRLEASLDPESMRRALETALREDPCATS